MAIRLVQVYEQPMDLLAFALCGIAMVVVVFAVGVTIEILFNRRFGAAKYASQGADLQAHQQGVRSQLGGFGPQGGPGN